MARFARQSSLMRAPQLIRGVRPTLDRELCFEERHVSFKPAGCWS